MLCAVTNCAGCRLETSTSLMASCSFTAKGGKRAHVPIAYENVADALYLHVVGEERQADEYLL